MTRKSVVRAESYTMNRNRVRSNTGTRKAKGKVTAAVAGMRGSDFEWASPKMRDKSIRETGSALKPRAKAKHTTRKAHSFLTGLSSGTVRKTKTTFSGKRKRWI